MCECVFTICDIILWAQDNSHAFQEYGYHILFSVNIEAVNSGDIVVGSYLLPGRLTAQKYHNFVNASLLGLIKDVSLAVWQSLWFQHGGASAHYGQGVQ
jgi:hypothetical protein